MAALHLGDEVKLVGKQSAIYGLGQSLSRAVGFFMIPVYTHYLTPADYGSLELIEVVSNLLALVVALGVAYAMPQFYYAEKDQRARNQVVSTILIGFALLTLPIVIIVMLFSRPLAGLIFQVPGFAIPLGLTISSTWFGVQCQAIATYLRLRYMAKTFVVVSTAQLVLGLLLNIYFVVFLRMSFVGICYSTFISQFLVAVLATFVILRRTYVRPSWGMLKRLVFFGLPLVPLRLASDMGTVTNRFCLRYLASPDPMVGFALVGLFSLANKLAVVINRFVNIPFNSLWVPRCRELLYENESDAKPVIARICTYSTLVSAYIALFIAAGGKPVIQIMADYSYRDAYVAVPILALAFVVLGMENHFMIGITYRNKTAWGLVIGLITLALILLASFILVPRYGLMGAAIAHLTAYCSRTILLYILSQRAFSIPFETRRIFGIYGMAALLYVAASTIWFHSVIVTLMIRFCIAAVFPAALAAFGFYHHQELVAAREYSMQILRFTYAKFHPALKAEAKMQAQD